MATAQVLCNEPALAESLLSNLPPEVHTYLVYGLDTECFFLLASTSRYFYRYRTDEYLEQLCRRTYALEDTFTNRVAGTDWKWMMEARKLLQDAEIEKFTGRGAYALANGFYYGEWKNGNRHGKGAMIFADNNQYYGDWLNDARHGKGTFIWEERLRFTLWLTRLGYGEFRWSSGNSYKGHWKGGNQHGYGVYLWENGNCYEGNWRKHQQHGKGKLTWTNGNIFEGEWMNGDKRDGTFREKPSNREFHGTLEATGFLKVDESMLADSLARCYRNDVCTYSVTGTKCYFQYLYKTRENDGITHGVCIPCYRRCVPVNRVKLFSDVLQFGGNFACECGALGNRCLCLP